MSQTKKYYRVTGEVRSVYIDGLIVRADSPHDAQCELECYLMDRIEIEDFKAIEIEEPDEMAINE